MAPKLQAQVLSFMVARDQEVLPKPGIPSRKVIGLRCSLVVEEALELLEACYGPIPETAIIVSMVSNVIAVRQPKVDLAEVADALGDLDYVSEGSRLAFGVDGESVADEIHKSNMAKVGGEFREDGKVLGKSKQWTPPDIEGVLFKQNTGDLPSVGDRQKGRVHFQPDEWESFLCFDNSMEGVAWPTDSCTDDESKVTCVRCLTIMDGSKSKSP